MRLAVIFILMLQFWSNCQTNGSYKLTGKTVYDFKLTNTNDSVFQLSANKNAKGFIVVFTCNHCPFAQLYSSRLNELNKRYAPLGVPLIAVNSMDSLLYEEETFINMKKKVSEAGFNFPYLWDNNQTVGKQFEATHTPQAFVIWKEGMFWSVKYKGLIDDNGEHPEKATSYVANAVEDLLQNKTVSLPFTESFGCKIFYRKGAYAKKVN